LPSDILEFFHYCWKDLKKPYPGVNKNFKCFD